MVTTSGKFFARLFARPAPPQVGPDTFLLWEPCTHSHAEVVPGFARYLLDLGYRVCVCMTPARYDEGLFSRFEHPGLQLCRMSQSALRRHFRARGMGNAAGMLITTARKISGAGDYAMEERIFSGRTSGQPLLLVEHDVREPMDLGVLSPRIITLREVHYRQARATVVNPHYFGDVNGPARPGPLVRFITIGALRGRRRNAGLLVEAMDELIGTGVRDFIVTVIGRGSLRGIPPRLRPHLEVLGRVDFRTLYEQMEQADFFLPLLDPLNPAHERYVTTGTSGSFQLILGFRKPCLIARRFAQANGLDAGNAVIYEDNSGLADAMDRAVKMTPASRRGMQQSLAHLADSLYQRSRENLRQLIGI